jgi:regulator of extracellular matrix RemA (YlzA/DUF370 family)
LSSARAKAPRRSRKTKSREKTPRKAAAQESGSVPPSVSREALGPAIPTMINVGYGNLIAAVRVVAIMSPGSAPMRRLREQAMEAGKLVDATEGRRTRSIVITDSDHIILSALNPDTVSSRFSPDGSGGGSE